MKIYHKNSLFAALGWFSLALLFVADTVLGGPEWDSLRVIQIILLFCLGLACLYTATNKKAAKAAMIQESDEMLRMEQLKSYRATFWTTVVLFLLISLVAAHFSYTDFGLALTLSSLLVVVIMILVNFFFTLSQMLQHS